MEVAEWEVRLEVWVISFLQVETVSPDKVVPLIREEVEGAAAQH